MKTNVNTDPRDYMAEASEFTGKTSMKRFLLGLFSLRRMRFDPSTTCHAIALAKADQLSTLNRFFSFILLLPTLLTGAIFATTGNTQSLHTRGSIFASRHYSSAEKPLNQFVAADFKMRSHIVKNSGQCSHFERVVIRNRDMMLVALAGGQPQMTPVCRVIAYPKRPSRLARSAPETSLGNFMLPNGAVSTDAQQARTSSRTKCNRITFGAFPSSKWQFTASRTCCRRVSNVSASVKMDSPKARAIKPPSTASSITKMISFMPYKSKAPLDSARFTVNSQGRSREAFRFRDHRCRLLSVPVTV